MVATISKVGSASAAVRYYGSFEEKDDLIEDGAEISHVNGNVAWEIFGDTPELTKEHLKSLLSGKNPETGEYLLRGEGKNHQPGWDLHFAPDKSVSVQWAMLDDKGRAQIQEAHDKAVNSAIREFERHFAYTRTGQGGKNREKVAGIAWSEFNHKTSRTNDPQLHTHNIIYNIALKTDGTYGALDSKTLYGVQKDLGLTYHRELARGLEDLGYKLELNKSDKPLTSGLLTTSQLHKSDGTFRIVGVPDQAVSEFSKRRKQIEAAALEHGYSKPAGINKAAVRSREAKKLSPMASLSRSWRRRGTMIGFGPKEASQLEKQRLGDKQRSKVSNLLQSMKLDRAQEFTKHKTPNGNKMLNAALSKTGQEIGRQVQKFQSLTLPPLTPTAIALAAAKKAVSPDQKDQQKEQEKARQRSTPDLTIKGL